MLDDLRRKSQERCRQCWKIHTSFRTVPGAVKIAHLGGQVLIKWQSGWQGRLHYMNGVPNPARLNLPCCRDVQSYSHDPRYYSRACALYVVPEDSGIPTAVWLISCSGQLVTVAPSDLRLASGRVGIETVLIGCYARSNRARQSHKYRVPSLLGAREV